MRSLITSMVASLLLLTAHGSLFAQRGAAPGRERPAPPLRHPLLMLLDENQDDEISAEEMARAVEVLKKLDRNRDGKLTASEMPPPPWAGRGGPFRPPGPGGPGGPPAGGEFLRRLRSLDQNGDRKISRDEAPERMQAMFDRLDTSGDGCLDEQELRAASERLGGPGGPEGGPPAGGPENAEDFVRRMLNLDTDGDGKISKDEAPERMQPMFDRADTSGDGCLDEAELKVVAERFAGRRPGRGGPPDGEPRRPRPPRSP